MTRRERIDLFAKPKPVPGETLDACPGCKKGKRASFSLCRVCEALDDLGQALPTGVTRCLTCPAWPKADGSIWHAPSCPTNPKYVPPSDGGSHDPDADVGPIDYLEGDR